MMKKEFKWDKEMHEKAMDAAMAAVTECEANAKHGKRAYQLVYGDGMKWKRLAVFDKQLDKAMEAQFVDQLFASVWGTAMLPDTVLKTAKSVNIGKSDTD